MYIEFIMKTNVTMYPDLQGKVAVITGASRGIGAETARVLAANGVKVVINGRDEQAIQNVVNSIKTNGGEAIGFACDVTDFSSLQKMREQCETKFGVAEIVIPFAGGLGLPQPTAEIDEAQWRKIIDVNLTSKFLTIKTFLPGMIQKQKGAIVVMSSTAGRQPGRANIAYGCGEAGSIMLVKQMANEFGKDGIRVNCVAPSAIRNQRMESAMNEDQIKELGKMFPLGRIGEPIDVAQATAFLVSDASSWITGVTLDITGGRVIVY
jgi:3-oxoacyl-[acyl-carrier protein] reductase